MAERYELYNAILNAIKVAGYDMQIGEIRSVLNKVEEDICAKVNPNRVKFSQVSDQLTEKSPANEAAFAGPTINREF